MALDERITYFNSLRQESQKSTQSKSDEIMDVNQKEVVDVMQSHQVSLLIHGHTHRPDIHRLKINGNTATRIVLGDWYEQGSILYYFDNGKFELRELTRH